MRAALAVALLAAAGTAALAQSTDVDVARAREKLASLPAEQKPPAVFIVEGACPSQCCRYGEWAVLADAELRSSPGGRVIGRLKAGEKAVAVGGQVRTRPRPYLVVDDHASFKAGEIIFAVYYVGEGVMRYWKNGRLVETDQSDSDQCDQSGTDCWAKALDRPFDAEDRAWWARVKTSDGRAGWSIVDDNLKPIDDCE